MKRTLGMLLTIGVAAGCGGATDHSASPAGATVTGVASLGAQVGAVVVMDASSPARQSLATVRQGGSFAADVSGLTPPFLLKAVPAGASVDAQYAIAQGAGRTNVNPVTTAAVLGATGGRGAAGLGTSAGLRSAAGGFDAILGQLGDVLKPLLDRYGVTSPVTRDDAAGVEALLREVRFAVHGDTLIVTDAATGRVIFQGSLGDLAAGAFDAANLPATDPAGASTPTPSGSPDGAALYGQRCASCHGALESSEVGGRSAAQIQATHSGKLTAAEAEAVAAALARSGSSGGTSSSGGSSGAANPVVDGVALYDRYCGSCHGSISGSSVAGRTLEQVLLFMSAGLSVDKLQAIVDAVNAAAGQTSGGSTSGGSTSGLDGAAVYGQRCASCHGDLSSSGIRGTAAAAIEAKHPGKVSSAEADAVAQALSASTSGGGAGNCGALDGVGIYNKYCAMCHGGALSRSSLPGVALGTISRFMSAGLSALQLQAIVDAVNGTSSTACPAPGSR